ncbi:MAG: LolA family protein [Bdellovibrionales bacterium]
MKRQFFYSVAMSAVLQFSSVALAVPKGSKELTELFQQIRTSPFVVLKVEKKTKSELLGTETVSPGTIYISSEKFRWDTDAPEKSRIIYDGETVWTVQDPPKGFKVPPLVTKMKLDKKNDSQILLKSLFQENFDKHFKVIKSYQENSKKVFKLAPLKQDSNLQDLEISLNSKSELSAIHYKDEVENKISVFINEMKLSKKPDLKLFQYKPPAGAQVTEI